jgi:pantothenate kinase type III
VRTLYVEVGNTTVKLARRTPEGGWIIERTNGVQSGLNRLKRHLPAERILLAPVAPERGGELSRMMTEEGVEHEVITHDKFTDFLAGSYDTPETLGLDRILNLKGLRGDGVVVSCGTCITVDMLYEGRPFFGGILSGYATAARSMASAVPTLPKGQLDGAYTIPSRTSRGAVNLGLLVGTTEAALGIARRLIKAVGAPSKDIPLITTGGGAPILMEVLRKLEKTDEWPDGEPVGVPELGFEGMGG